MPHMASYHIRMMQTIFLSVIEERNFKLLENEHQFWIPSLEGQLSILCNIRKILNGWGLFVKRAKFVFSTPDAGQ